MSGPRPFHSQSVDAWRQVFDSGEWDTMLLKYVVPKLGARLREDFRVNPRKQDMAPLQDVLLWEDLLRPSILSQQSLCKHKTRPLEDK